MLGILGTTAGAVRRARALSGSPACSGRCVNGTSFLLTDANAYDFHRPSDDDPTSPLWAGYASGNVIGGSTYVNGVAVDGTSFNMPTNLHNGFNLVEVLTTDTVTADSFNKDRGYHSGNQ